MAPPAHVANGAPGLPSIVKLPAALGSPAGRGPHASKGLSQIISKAETHDASEGRTYAPSVVLW